MYVNKHIHAHIYMNLMHNYSVFFYFNVKYLKIRL